MLINLSNHPYESWSRSQKEAAEKLYGSVTDMQFPKISPHYSETEIALLAEEYCYKIQNMLADVPMEENAVHLMGEFSFTYSLLNKLKEARIPAVASTTERNTYNLPEGTKVVKFNFIMFREYY